MDTSKQDIFTFSFCPRVACTLLGRVSLFFLTNVLTFQFPSLATLSLSFRWNSFGQLGQNMGEDKLEYSGKIVEIMLPGNEKISKIFLHKGSHQFIVTESGKIYSMGDNGTGECAIPRSESREKEKWVPSSFQENRTHINRPVLLPQLLLFNTTSRIRKISTYYCTFFIFESGDVFCCGYNFHNNLGIVVDDHDEVDNDQLFQSGVNSIDVPIRFEIPNEDIDTIECGYAHTIFLTKTKNIYCCGLNENGQLGTNYPKEVNKPIELEFFRNEREKGSFSASEICCGRNFCLVVTSNFKVFSWGLNKMGALGVGDFKDRHTPCLVEALKNERIVRVRTGEEHTCFMSNPTRIFFCGRNESYQFGETFEPKIICVPMLFTPPKSFLDKQIVDVQGGNGFTVLLTRHGYVYGCGTNTYSQVSGSSDEDRCNYVKKWTIRKNFVIQFDDSKKFRKKLLSCNSYSDVKIICEY